jgi:hypothetical protein
MLLGPKQDPKWIERRHDTMKDILKRDITGECVGACKNTVREAEEKRQREIDAQGIESADAFPNVGHAFSRDAPPGFLGGHV